MRRDLSTGSQHAKTLDWTAIDGWLYPAEGRELQRLADGQCVLEIGSLFGRSTVCMAQTARSITSVDPHDGATLDGTQWAGVNSLPQFQAHLLAAGVADRVQVIVGRIQDVTDRLGTYSLVFIDGEHTETACKRDLRIAATVLDQDGGIIAVHDYHSGNRQHDGVVKAVDSYRGNLPFRRVGSLAIIDCRRPA